MGRAVTVILVGVALALWFWFGWPPIGSPAVVSGSDYVGVSPISIALAAIGVIVAGWGVVMLVRRAQCAQRRSTRVLAKAPSQGDCQAGVRARIPVS